MAEAVNFGQSSERELAAMDAARKQLFSHYLAHLRQIEDGKGLGAFGIHADQAFLWAARPTPILVGEKKVDHEQLHFGRVTEARKEYLRLDSFPREISPDGVTTACLYRFAIPVFPRSQKDVVRQQVENAGIVCEDLSEWLDRAAQAIKDQNLLASPIPRISLICPRSFASAGGNGGGLGAGAALSTQDILELGFLLSSCNAFIMLDDGGAQIFSDFLAASWRAGYKRWFERRLNNNRLKYFTPRKDELREGLDDLLNFRQLTQIRGYAQHDSEPGL